MNMLRGETDETRLLLNFRAYLDGFSKHVQDVITKFDLRHYVEKLNDVHRLGMMIDKMTDKSIKPLYSMTKAKRRFLHLTTIPWERCLRNCCASSMRTTA